MCFFFATGHFGVRVLWARKLIIFTLTLRSYLSDGIEFYAGLYSTCQDLTRQCALRGPFALAELFLFLAYMPYRLFFFIRTDTSPTIARGVSSQLVVKSFSIFAAQRYAICVCPPVCVYVYLHVTSRCSTETAKRRIKQTMPTIWKLCCD